MPATGTPFWIRFDAPGGRVATISACEPGPAFRQALRGLTDGLACSSQQPLRCAGEHTAFLYLEDDDFLSWKALLAWADDQAELAALGFTRDFVRVETRTDGARHKSTLKLMLTPLHTLQQSFQLILPLYRFTSDCVPEPGLEILVLMITTNDRRVTRSTRRCVPANANPSVARSIDLRCRDLPAAWGQCAQHAVDVDVLTSGARCTAGVLMALGQPRVNISSYELTVRLQRPGCDVDGRACDFMQVPNAYSSVWLLSRERVQHFVTTPFWRCVPDLSRGQRSQVRPCSAAGAATLIVNVFSAEQRMLDVSGDHASTAAIKLLIGIVKCSRKCRASGCTNPVLAWFGNSWAG